MQKNTFRPILTAPSMLPRADPELVPGFERINPHLVTCPLVFCSAHSGNLYPRRFLQSSRLDALALRRSEDAHVDQLFGFAPQIGAPLLRALFPRAYLDANREPYELDPRMFEGRLPAHANTRSLRVAAGLGTIARVVGENQEIYARKLQPNDALERIEGLYKPFHAALGQTLGETQDRFGQYILVDCHSMPSSSAMMGRGTSGAERADFVIGDRFGTSCDPDVSALLEDELQGLGYGVARNKPYAGGYITEHYGQPQTRGHAIQIEINRALYMDERTLEPNANFQLLSQDIRLVCAALARFSLANANNLGVAAE